MKTLLTSFICLGLSIGIFGQTVITHTHLTPTIGSVVKKKSTQANPVDYLTNGQNVTWNLSLMTTNINDSTTYIDVSNAQNPNLDPNASFVKQLNQGELFVRLNDSLYSNSAFYAYQNQGINYNFNVNFSLPMEYGNIDTTYIYDTLNATGTNVYRKFTCVHSVVGEGVLNTPEGTFNNCLKSKVIRNFRDSSASTQQITETTDTTYHWFSPNFADPLMSISIVYQEATQQIIYYTTFQEVSALSTTKFNKVDLKIYPLPATGILNISNVPSKCQLKVLDMLGRTVDSFTLHKGLQQIDLGYLEKGNYQLIFIHNDFEISRPLILQ